MLDLFWFLFYFFHIFVGSFTFGSTVGIINFGYFDREYAICELYTSLLYLLCEVDLIFSLTIRDVVYIKLNNTYIWKIQVHFNER